MRRRWPFIAELARLERAALEVFHAPDAAPLAAAAMRAVAPPDWPAVMLRTQPALEILDCAWKVDEVARAVEARRAWSEPQQAPVSILVWRQNFQVYYRELDQTEVAALRVARDGASFAAICEAAAGAAPQGDAVETIGGLLARWLADGLLVRF